LFIRKITHSYSIKHHNPPKKSQEQEKKYRFCNKFPFLNVGYKKKYYLWGVLKQYNDMKGLSIFAAFLGGAIVGAATGLLFAPEKGVDTRLKIAEALRKRGIRLSKKETEELISEIADELKGADQEA
jgi:hypothetical protein